MKKVLRYLLMTVMAICFSIPCFGAAEAASVALLPLINNVEGGDELANQVFYKNALAVLNSNKVPSAATLEKIAKDGDVDIVIAVQLDKLDDRAIDSSEERKLQIDLQGYAVAYNKLTGKAYEHRIYSDKTIPEALTSRWDWTHEEFGRAVRIEVDRALRVK